MSGDVLRLLEARRPWVAGPVPDDVPHGDMPGDSVAIGPAHVAKAATLLPALVEELQPALGRSPWSRAVVSVAGGSGVGKSEVASLLSFHLRALGLGAYTLSGDNYPRRVPRHNDAERLRVFRDGGARDVVAHGLHTPERGAALRELQLADLDADPARAAGCDWLAVYQEGGRRGLRGYLGTPAEIHFDELNGVVRQFASGAATVHLRRMGRGDADVWYDAVDLSGVDVLVVEWTHGLNDHLHGVDVPILLASTPAETLEHRRSRNRDGGVDSAFTTTVLGVEQELLDSQAARASIVLSKDGELRRPGHHPAAARLAERSRA